MELGRIPPELWHLVLSDLCAPFPDTASYDYDSGQIKTSRKTLMHVSMTCRSLKRMARKYLFEDLVLLDQAQALRFLDSVDNESTQLTRNLRINFFSHNEHTNLFLSIQVSAKMGELFPNLVSLHVEDCLRAQGLWTRFSIDFLAKLKSLRVVCLHNLSLVWRYNEEDTSSQIISRELDEGLVCSLDRSRKPPGQERSPGMTSDSMQAGKSGAGSDRESESWGKLERNLKRISLRDSHLNNDLLIGFLQSQSLTALEEVDLSGCRGLDERILEVLKQKFIGESQEAAAVAETEEKGEKKREMRLKKLDLSDTYLVGIDGIGDVWEDEAEDDV